MPYTPGKRQPGRTVGRRRDGSYGVACLPPWSPPNSHKRPRWPGDFHATRRMRRTTHTRRSHCPRMVVLGIVAARPNDHRSDDRFRSIAARTSSCSGLLVQLSDDHECSKTNQRLSAESSLERLRTIPAETASLFPVCGRDWIAVGDAATSFDPLSSSGIVKAMDSAKHAAWAIVAASRGDHAALDRYALQVEKGFELFRDLTPRDNYQQANRWPAAPFWCRRPLRPESVSACILRGKTCWNEVLPFFRYGVLV